MRNLGAQRMQREILRRGDGQLQRVRRDEGDSVGDRPPAKSCHDFCVHEAQLVGVFLVL